MMQEYAPWIALAAAMVGTIAGYFMGYRTGRIEGELAALKATRSRQRSSSRGLNSESKHTDSYSSERSKRDELELGHTIRGVR